MKGEGSATRALALSVCRIRCAAYPPRTHWRTTASGLSASLSTWHGSLKDAHQPQQLSDSQPTTASAPAQTGLRGAPARRPGRSPITRVQRSACVSRGHQRRSYGPLDACGCLRQALGQERPRLLSTHTEEFKHPAGRTHTLGSCLEVCLPARDPLVPCSHPSYDPVCRTLRFSARNKMSLAGSRPRSRSLCSVSFVSTAPAPGVCPSMRGRSCPTTCPEGTTDCQEARRACADAREKRRRTS
ncbi:hypothetical protein H4W33_002230 [Kibdelosporangium phytohabitans]|nr:hypothetical protein [Kibdelosporangium phytohabitans]